MTAIIFLLGVIVGFLFSILGAILLTKKQDAAINLIQKAQGYFAPKAKIIDMSDPFESVPHIEQ